MDFIEIGIKLLKISTVFFMAGNLLDMGLRLNIEDAIRSIRNLKFVFYTIVFGFILGPALAWLVTVIIPLDKPFAIGLILMGMAPCAPFIPSFVTKAKGDLGCTAAFMFLIAIGTIIFMPVAVPFMVKGLSITAWAIAKPLIIMILFPLLMGITIKKFNASFAEKILPAVKKVTLVFSILVFVLMLVIYHKGIISVMGSLAIVSQLLFFFTITVLAYVLSFGLKYEERIVLSIGNSTRNLGASVAPLFIATGIPPEAIIMIALSLPVMLLFPFIAIKLFGRNTKP